MSRSLRAAAMLAVSSLMACGVVIYDTTSRVLILEPVERLVFASDDGAVEVYAFDRTAISLYYYLSGYETSIAEIGHHLEDGVLRAVIDCDGDDLCLADWYAEVPLGTAIEIRAESGAVKLTGVDADVAAVVGEGTVEGVGLASPTFDLTVDAGAVDLEWAVPPTSLTISVESGDVALTLPIGAYRCDLAAPAGEVDTGDITCDPAATAALTISTQTGDITLQGSAP